MGIVNYYQSNLAVIPLAEVSVGVTVLYSGLVNNTPEVNKYLAKNYVTSSLSTTATDKLDLGVIA